MSGKRTNDMKNLNPSQRAAVECGAPLILAVAGPGSGKTHTLCERIRRLLDGGARAEEMVVITFTNAAADEMLKRLSRGGDAPAFGYIGTLHGFILRQLRRKSSRLSIIDEELRERIVKEVTAEMRWKGSAADVVKAIAKGPDAFKGTTPRPAERIALAYFQRIAEAGMLDFDCVLHYGAEWVKTADALPFKFLFVDEYQDSGPIDAFIYERIPIANKFFVGDPDQSIYSFRGGDVRFIRDMAADPLAHVIFLQENYRCGAEICGCAQRLIQHNTGRVHKEMTSCTGTEGTVEHWHKLTSHLHELMAIAKDLATATPERLRECAVLVRSNALVKHFADGLKQLGIPVKQRARTDAPPDWKRCRTLCALLANPDNDTVAHWWIATAKGEAVADGLRSEAARQMRSINSLSYNLQPVDDLAAVPQSLARGGCGLASVEAVRKVIAGLPAGAGMLELNFALAARGEPTEDDGEGVTVSTIHGAKGREWNEVFLPAFEQGILPSTRAANLEEDRRLAFVAFTRARDRLVVSHADARPVAWSKRGDMADADQSQFVAEARLDPDAGASDGQPVGPENPESN